MGIYTDYFVATDAEATRLDLDAGVIDPGAPSCKQDGWNFLVTSPEDGGLVAVEGKPVGALVAALLSEVLLARTEEPRLLRTAGGEPELDPDDAEIWLYRYSDDLRDALAQLEDHRIDAAARRWQDLAGETGPAASESFRWLLSKLVLLCRRGAARREALLARESL